MATVSDRPSAPVGTPDLELLQKFEPVVYYTKGEQFFPTQVEHYVEDSTLWEHHPEGHDELLVSHGQMNMESIAASCSATQAAMHSTCAMMRAKGCH